MTAFAAGKHALGLCDRCGFRYGLNDLRTLTINDHTVNTLVCDECWEADHPQLKQGKYPVNDPIALRNSRPDPALDQSRTLTDPNAFLNMVNTFPK